MITCQNQQDTKINGSLRCDVRLKIRDVRRIKWEKMRIQAKGSVLLNVNSSFVINLKMSVLGVCYVCIISSFSCVLVYEY